MTEKKQAIKEIFERTSAQEIKVDRDFFKSYLNNGISNKAKKDNEIMKLLKISELNHFIARTNRGELMLHLPFEGTSEDYRFTLDSVRVDDETNKELIKQFNGILYTL